MVSYAVMLVGEIRELVENNAHYLFGQELVATLTDEVRNGLYDAHRDDSDSEYESEGDEGTITYP